MLKRPNEVGCPAQVGVPSDAVAPIGAQTKKERC